uniref:Immunoglobulin domain-containing protein n=1 Tax=Cyprinus carpio carpio TaxID=630221 RepID=A0A8C1BH48_CYPCA
MRNLSFICWILLLVDVSPSGHVKTNDEHNMARIEQYSGMNVFVAVADGVKTVVVVEGDSVTLNTNVTAIQRDDTILWMFGDDNSIIAKMNEAAGIFSANDNERFRDRLELDKQTGSLIIKNIRTEHTGLYQLKIKSTTEISKKFSVTVRDLTIRNIQTEHSGDYDLEINNSSMILHKKFHIAVSELPPRSHWETTGPVLAGIVVILILIGIGICIGLKMGWFEICWPCKKNGETNEVL